ncbi:MAG: hypothetical protein ACM3SS_18745 [Rhodospirillaceae bacterium]
MAHAEVYTRTAKGMLEIRNRASALPLELQAVLKSIEGLATVSEVCARVRLGHGLVQHAVQQLQVAGYITPAAANEEADLDFTAPGAMTRLQAEAEARARAEAAARARAEQARRDAAAAKLREQEQARAQQQAQEEAARAAEARAKADAAARAADQERARAAVQADAARTAESKAVAQQRMEAALIAEAQAAARAREMATAESAARETLTQTQNNAALAREEAQARARAESEAEARAHAEAHARAMVEAQLKAMSAALARAQTLAREEAEARAKLTADLQAREAAEARASAEAAAQARADAEMQMRAELAKLRAEAKQAVEEAAAQAEAERLAREAAEALAQQERSARANAEARAAAQLEAQRRAHAAARAATQARIDEERLAREAAESRAQAELQARLAHEQALAASAEERVRERVAQEIQAREEAERAADAEYRAELARRAALAAASQPPAPAKFELPRKPLDKAFALKAGAAAVVLVLFAAAVMLPAMPLDGYSFRVEKAASSVLQQPVRVGKMQYHLLPRPELVIDRVAVGASYGTRIEQISVSAWPWEFFGAQPSFDAVTVTGAVIGHEGWPAVRALVAAPRPGVRADRIKFSSARITMQDIELPISSAAVHFRNGNVQSITVASGNATLDAAPASTGGWRIALNARTWQPPVGPSMMFDSFSAKGVIDGQRLKNASFEGAIAGGELKATVAADWRDGVKAEGRFEVAKSQLQLLMPAYTPHFTARGTIAATGRYRFEAPSLGKLVDNPRITAEFNVASGELGNVDIVRALQQVTAKGIQGGRTRFDQVTGNVEVAGDRYRYRQLKLTSGAMSAAGDVDIGSGNQLSGRVSADVKTSSQTAIRGLLTVTGTLTNPVLKP